MEFSVNIDNCITSWIWQWQISLIMQKIAKNSLIAYSISNGMRKLNLENHEHEYALNINDPIMESWGELLQLIQIHCLQWCYKNGLDLKSCSSNVLHISQMCYIEWPCLVILLQFLTLTTDIKWPLIFSFHVPRTITIFKITVRHLFFAQISTFIFTISLK